MTVIHHLYRNDQSIRRANGKALISFSDYRKMRLPALVARNKAISSPHNVPAEEFHHLHQTAGHFYTGYKSYPPVSILAQDLAEYQGNAEKVNGRECIKDRLCPSQNHHCCCRFVELEPIHRVIQQFATVNPQFGFVIHRVWLA